MKYSQFQYPTLRAERKLWKKGYKRVACLDEAGRGSLAGPVTAAAVTVRQFLISNSQFLKVKDSKKLTPKRRKELYKILTKNPAIKWGIGRVSEKVIDKINILEATKLAMKKALKNLEKKIIKKSKKSSVRKTYDREKIGKSHDRGKFGQPEFLIIDGNFTIDNLRIPQKAIIKADEKVFSCSVASIIAKVTRDRIMEKLHKKYPRYRFDRHKGYPTKYHLKMLRKYGHCKIHRKSFKPVRKLKSKSVKRKTTGRRK